MLGISSFTFFIFASFAVHAFYLPLYLQHNGLSNGEIGLVMGLGSFIAIFAQPFWGIISDRKKTIKRVLAFVLTFGLITGLILFTSSNALIGSLMLMALFMFFFSSVGPLTESLMVNFAQVNQRTYGSIRLWGEVGIGISALTLGMIIERTSISYLWIMFSIIVMCGFIAMLWLPDAKAHAVPVRKETLVRLFTNRTFLLFLGLSLFLSIPHRMNDTFLSIYFEAMGASDLVGLAWSVATFCAVPAMALIGTLLKKRSELFFITFAGCFYIVRWVIYSFASSPLLIIIGQGLHMLTFPLLLVAAIHFIHKIIPPELIATGQTVFTAVFFGIGGIVGSTIGGIIMDQFGPQILYLSGAALTFIGVVAMFISRPYFNASLQKASLDRIH